MTPSDPCGSVWGSSPPHLAAVVAQACVLPWATTLEMQLRITLSVARCHCREGQVWKKKHTKKKTKGNINIHILKKVIKNIWKLYCECDLVTMRTFLLKCSSDILVPLDENGFSFYVPFSDWQELSTGTGSDIGKPLWFWCGRELEESSRKNRTKKTNKKNRVVWPLEVASHFTSPSAILSLTVILKFNKCSLFVLADFKQIHL